MVTAMVTALMAALEAAEAISPAAIEQWIFCP
jgi:hypothetical protein